MCIRPRLLTILADNTNAPKDNTVSDSIMNYMAEAQNNASMFQVNDAEPSAECLAIDATNGCKQQMLHMELVLYHKVI